MEGRLAETELRPRPKAPRSSGTLSGPAIPVSPQAAGPASLRGESVQEVFRGALLCQGVRKSSLPGKARGFRGARTPSSAMAAGMPS